MRSNLCAIRFTLMAILLTLATLAIAESEPFTPVYDPELNVRPSAGEITIDGLLDDPGWRGAARATNFTELTPGDCVAPARQTEVLVTYDKDNLYLAFLADDDPAEVRAGLRDRDEIWQDDYIGIVLDTFADQAWGYELFANPLGIQGDLRRMDDGNEDMGFDLIWHSEGKLTDSGFQVEFAIPFSSLRFPDAEEQTWHATFWRRRPRTFRETSSWAAQSRDDPCFLCQMGTLRGIRGVESGNRLEILPSVIGFQSGSLDNAYDPDANFTMEDAEAEASVGLKYAMGPDLSFEATWNPDFSQIESDAAQVSVNNPYALYQPERRPFFQRGGNLFATQINAVHTRSVMDPLVAAKLSARRGNTSILYLTALDELSLFVIPFAEASGQVIGERSISNILRARHSAGNGTMIGGLLTDRRIEDGGSNTVGGLDFTRRFGGCYRFEFQAMASRTEEPDDPDLSAEDNLNGLTFDNGKHTADFDGETFNGHALFGNIVRQGRHWSFGTDWESFSPTFRADNGFITTNNRHLVNSWTDYTFRLGGKILDRITPRTVVGRIWNYDGKWKDGWVRALVVFHLARQSRLELHQMWSGEVFSGVTFNGIRRFTISGSSVPSDNISCGGYIARAHTIYRSGNPFLGREIESQIWANLRLGQRLRIDPSVHWVRLDHPQDDSLVFDNRIARARIKYQASRRLFLRLVLEYVRYEEPGYESGTLNVEPLVSYKVNPFTVFYLGSTHGGFKTDYYDGNAMEDVNIDWRERSRQYFVKFQYLFQV